jgi:hypothetical protein
MSIKKKSRILAVLLSFIFPGLGQFYLRRIRKGVALIMLSLIAICIMIGGFVASYNAYYEYSNYYSHGNTADTTGTYAFVAVLGFIIYAIVWLAGLSDASRDAKKINRMASLQENANSQQGHSNEPRYHEQYPGQ